jgi:hypothetical protein
MDPRAASKKRRPWWRLHVTTLFALAAVGSALGYCESKYHAGATFGTNLLSTHQIGDYGWPLSCLQEFSTTDYSVVRSGQITRAKLQSDVPAAMFDLVAVVAMLISAAAACEVWRRRKLRWCQFSIRSFFVATTIATIVASLYFSRLPVSWCRSELHPGGQSIYYFGLVDFPWNPTPWYVTAAMLFGIACVVFTCGWAVSHGIAATWKWVRRSLVISKVPSHLAKDR